MAQDLIKKNEVVGVPANPVIVANLASLPGGVMLNMENVILPEGEIMLYAGHPVAQCSDGSWQPCDIDDEGYTDFQSGIPNRGFGVLLNDTPVDAPVASIMIIGVVDCAASHIPYTHTADLGYTGHGVSFINSLND